MAHEPHRIAFYLYDLAAAVPCACGTAATTIPARRFLVENNPQLSRARLELARGIGQIIRSGLGLMGVEARRGDALMADGRAALRRGPAALARADERERAQRPRKPSRGRVLPGCWSPLAGRRGVVLLARRAERPATGSAQRDDVRRAAAEPRPSRLPEPDAGRRVQVAEPPPAARRRAGGRAAAGASRRAPAPAQPSADGDEGQRPVEDRQRARGRSCEARRRRRRRAAAAPVRPAPAAAAPLASRQQLQIWPARQTRPARAAGWSRSARSAAAGRPSTAGGAIVARLSRHVGRLQAVVGRAAQLRSGRTLLPASRSAPPRRPIPKCCASACGRIGSELRRGRPAVEGESRAMSDEPLGAMTTGSCRGCEAVEDEDEPRGVSARKMLAALAARAARRGDRRRDLVLARPARTRR